MYLLNFLLVSRERNYFLDLNICQGNVDSVMTFPWEITSRTHLCCNVWRDTWVHIIYVPTYQMEVQIQRGLLASPPFIATKLSFEKVLKLRWIVNVCCTYLDCQIHILQWLISIFPLEITPEPLLLPSLKEYMIIGSKSVPKLLSDHTALYCINPDKVDSL